MERIGLGKLGLTPDVLWMMTLREFFNTHEGYLEHERYIQREAWERMRMQTAALLQVHMKKGRQLKPKDVFKFEWDGEAVEKKPFSRKDAEYAMRKFGLKGKLLHSGGLD